MFEEIRKFIAEKLSRNPSDITEKTDLMKDLGVDSIDMVELLAAMETKYGFEISSEDQTTLLSVGDFVKYVEKNRKK